MRSDANQMDLYRDSPHVLAEKWRQAAEASRQQFPDDEQRYAYYMREAEKLEKNG